MQTINVPNKSEIRKMIQEEIDRQTKFYLKELTKIRVKLADLERILEVVRE